MPHFRDVVNTSTWLPILFANSTLVLKRIKPIFGEFCPCVLSPEHWNLGWNPQKIVLMCFELSGGITVERFHSAAREKYAATCPGNRTALALGASTSMSQWSVVIWDNLQNAQEPTSRNTRYYASTVQLALTNLRHRIDQYSKPGCDKAFTNPMRIQDDGWLRPEQGPISSTFAKGFLNGQSYKG